MNVNMLTQWGQWEIIRNQCKKQLFGKKAGILKEVGIKGEASNYFSRLEYVSQFLLDRNNIKEKNEANQWTSASWT